MKKAISILMALIMIFSVLSVGATALDTSEPSVKTKYVGSEAVNRYSPDMTLPQDGASAEANVNKFASADPNAPYTFYSTLNARQKDVYNAVLNGAKPQATFEEIMFSSPITFTTVMDDNGEPALTEQAAYACVETLLGALSALMDDHPEMFWIGNFDWGYLYDYRSNSNGSVDVRLVGLMLQFKMPEGYATWDAVKTAYTQMMQAADAVQIAGANRFEKLKGIHDWIAKRVDYDTKFAYATSYYATSVFLAPYITVCEGYAEAFKMLCDRAGIPCIVVVGFAGEAHAWNYVKMEDGNWYAVDVTWDDQNAEDGSDIILYDFFLRGANSTEIFFHGENQAATAFKDTHKPLGDRYGDGSIFKLSYPALTQEGYTRMLLAPNSEATVDKTSMTVSLPDGTDIADAFLVPDGYRGYASEDEPVLQIMQIIGGQEKLVEEYDIHWLKAGRLGDVNGDGKVNTIDARWALQAASGVRVLTEAQKAAADVNGDGKVNTIDARWILQMASGVRPVPAA